MQSIRPDLNNPVFQKDWFALERAEALAAVATLRKMAGMDWSAVHRDRGLRWEAIQSRTGPAGQRVYSLRLTRRMRAVAFRDGGFLRFLSLHSDRDPAHQ